MPLLRWAPDWNNYLNAILKPKSNISFFIVRSIFVSHMNTKSGISTRGSATRENIAFGVHSKK